MSERREQRARLLPLRLIERLERVRERHRVHERVAFGERADLVARGDEPALARVEQGTLEPRGAVVRIDAERPLEFGAGVAETSERHERARIEEAQVRVIGAALDREAERLVRELVASASERGARDAQQHVGDFACGRRAARLPREDPARDRDRVLEAVLASGLNDVVERSALAVLVAAHDTGPSVQFSQPAATFMA